MNSTLSYSCNRIILYSLLLYLSNGFNFFLGRFSWTLLEKRPNPKTLKRFAVLCISSPRVRLRRCALNFATLFKVLRNNTNIRHILLKEKRKVNGNKPTTSASEGVSRDSNSILISLYRVLLQSPTAPASSRRKPSLYPIFLNKNIFSANHIMKIQHTFLK